jgi:cold shock CspA family protein/ribosome-associated translation inhibitor RaiA
MAPPIQVSWHRFDPPDHIREKIAALMEQFDSFEDTITDGRVVVEGANKHGDKTVVDINVELNVKGKRIVGKRTGEYPDPVGQRTFERAATEAFRVALRQLKAHTDKLQPHETKQLDHQPQRGRIESLDRIDETGFIEMPDGVSLFFSKKVLKDTEFRALLEGDTVIVTIADSESPYGPQASSVELESPDVRSR